MEGQIFLTPEEAISVLNEGENIHTFRNPNGMMIGCDWSRESIIETLKKEDVKIEIGGPQCQAMGRALVVHDHSILFVEADRERIKELEKSKQ